LTVCEAASYSWQEERKTDKREVSAEAMSRLEKLKAKEQKARVQEGQKKKSADAPKWMQEITTIM
jgi:hypothetical protein